MGVCVWNQQNRGDSSSLDTGSEYAPDFRKKIKWLPTQAMSVAKARVDRCWLLVTVLREMAEGPGSARTGSRKT